MLGFFDLCPAKSKQTALLACRNRTAESYFLSKENRRAGDQTKLFDEKVLGEVDKATAGPTKRTTLLAILKKSLIFNRIFFPGFA